MKRLAGRWRQASRTSRLLVVAGAVVTVGFAVDTMPLRSTSVKSTVPVMMSGPWCSAPIFFQYSASSKICWYCSRSFSVAIFGAVDAESPAVAA